MSLDGNYCHLVQAQCMNKSMTASQWKTLTDKWMSVFLVLQCSEAITHSEVPKLRGSSGVCVWGFWVCNAPLKLSWLKKWARVSQVELQEEGTGTLCSPSLWRIPRGAKPATAVIEGPFQLPDLELSWGLGDCQTCALKPSSCSPCTWQAASRVTRPENAFPTWLLSTSKLNRKHVVVFGSKMCLLFLVSLLLKKAGRRKSCWVCRDAADTLHVHSMLCTDPEPCPTTGGVTARVCH